MTVCGSIAWGNGTKNAGRRPHRRHGKRGQERGKFWEIEVTFWEDPSQAVEGQAERTDNISQALAAEARSASAVFEGMYGAGHPGEEEFERMSIGKLARWRKNPFAQDIRIRCAPSKVASRAQTRCAHINTRCDNRSCNNPIKSCNDASLQDCRSLEELPVAQSEIRLCLDSCPLGFLVLLIWVGSTRCRSETRSGFSFPPRSGFPESH
jgi:hypothetical protein